MTLFPCYDLLRYVNIDKSDDLPFDCHLSSVEIRFAPLVVYDYSRLYIYIGFILFYISMCIRHTEYIYMVCNLCFHAKIYAETGFQTDTLKSFYDCLALLYSIFDWLRSPSS